MWKDHHHSRFQWLSYNCTNYADYNVECKYDGMSQRQIREANSNSNGYGVKFVLQSLTNRHHEILKILATKQLAKLTQSTKITTKKSTREFKGMSFHEYYEKCGAEMITSSDAEVYLFFYLFIFC